LNDTLSGEPAHDTNSPTAAARAALEIVPWVIGDSKHLPSKDIEGVQVELGDAVRSCFIRRDDLRRYESGGDVRDLLSPTYAVMFPVIRSKQVVSSITVALNPAGKWAFESVGYPDQAQAVSRLRERDAAISGRCSDDYFLVTIPALHLLLLAAAKGNDLMVSRVFGNEHAESRPVVWERAGDVIAAAAYKARSASEDSGPGNAGPGGSR
jgi:hypothetical protein